MKFLFFYLTVIFSLSANAAPLFTCELIGKRLIGVIKVTDKDALLEVKKREADKFSTCPLKLVSTYDGRKSIVSELTLLYEKQPCDKGASAVSAELLKDIRINITLQKKESVFVQWLVKEQPQDCRLIQFDLDSLIKSLSK